MSFSLEFVSGSIGLDEAGRGPLAGPVVAAAVCLPDGFDTQGLRDSKKLTRSQREALEIRIRQEAHFGLGQCSPAEIDSLNILEASMEAMRRAFEALGITGPTFVDGNRVPRGMEATAVVKGDDRFYCIAAASILAKTERDRILTQLAGTYPLYGFEANFGYPTPDHLAALREHGPTPVHRRSFAPVAALAQGELF